MQQAEFILSNLFIIHPDHRSNYKLRIVINHQSSQQKIKQTAQRYKFALALNETMLQHPYGYIYLLQQSSRIGNYLQIGKGELDFNEVLSSQSKDQVTLNGVIYGTRAVNFDRIIAKYGYRIERHRVDAEKMAQRKKEMKFNRIRFKDHKLKEKLPVLRFKESIIDRSNDLNAKILRLSNAVGMDGLQREKIDVTFGEKEKQSLVKIEASRDNKRAQLQIKSEKMGKVMGSESKKKLEEKHHYFYKINEKIEKLVQQQDWAKLKWLQIKNIQLFKYRTLKEQIAQTENNYDNDLLLLSVSQGLNKICEVVLKLIFNTNNRFIDLILPIPSMLQSINLTISFLQYNTERLQGSTKVNSSVNKTVDLCNEQGEEKGFVSLEILKQNGLIVNMEKYKSQANDFVTLSSQFPNSIKKDLSYSELKNSQLQTLESRIRSNKISHPTMEIPNKASNPLYNSLLPKKSRFSQLRKDHQSVIQRMDSELSTQKRIRKSFDNRSYLQNNSNFSSISPSSKPKDISFLPNSLSLKIKNIYIHFYEERERNISYLKFVLRNRVEVRQVYNGFNNLQGQGGALILSDLQPQQSIHVRCQAQEEKDSKMLGTCVILVKNLIKSTGRQLKIFLSKDTSLCGYLIFEVSLYRIKNNKVKIYKKTATVPSPQTESDQFQLQLTQSQIRLQNYHQPSPAVKPDFNQSFLIYQQQYQ